MQKFLEVLSVVEVQALLRNIPSLANRTEEVELEQAAGRILAEEVISACDVPSANRSAMDGYAVCAADLFGTTDTNPVWLECIGEISIEHPADFVIRQGQCAAIMTGAHIPQGADAVVMVEYTRTLGTQMIEIRRPVAPGEAVLWRGDDAQKGEVLLPYGTFLRAQELGLLAAVGVTRVNVFPIPIVHIISTGDEIIPAKDTPKSGQVRDVNRYTLAALTRCGGASPHFCGIIPDILEALQESILASLIPKEGDIPDVLLLSGGSSVGVRDLTVTALEQLPSAFSTNIFCHGVALSPGKPLILATVTHATGQTTVWGLPGQVASAQTVMTILGLPFLKHLGGHGLRGKTPNPFDQRFWPTCQARLSRNIASKPGREDYIRVTLQETPDGDLLAVPVNGLSGLLSPLTKAHGLVQIPANLEGLLAESRANVLLFPDQSFYSAVSLGN